MGVDRSLLESLARWRHSKAVILGVGNVLKGDDAAGPVLCERLSGASAAEVIDGGTVPENHIRPIQKIDPDVLLIVDAIDFGGLPGQIRLFEPAEISRFVFSTHTLSLHLFIDLLQGDRALDVRLVGIQAGPRRLGEGLSPPTQEAVQTLSDTFQTLFPPSR